MHAAIGGGSDLDVVLILKETSLPFEQRAVQFDLTELPVPVDVLVYTDAEWEGLIQQPGFGKQLKNEVIWMK